jgi:hypothetical protein
MRVVLRGFDAFHRVVVVEAEPVCVEKDRLQLVESVGLRCQPCAVALHGLDKGVNDLVVEAARPAALERGQEVVCEERVEVAR